MFISIISLANCTGHFIFRIFGQVIIAIEISFRNPLLFLQFIPSFLLAGASIIIIPVFLTTFESKTFY